MAWTCSRASRLRPGGGATLAAVLAKLPQDWRDVAKHVKAIDQEQQRFLKLSDVVLRQTIARILIRSRAAEGFLKAQVTKSPRRRSA